MYENFNARQMEQQKRDIRGFLGNFESSPIVRHKDEIAIVEVRKMIGDNMEEKVFPLRTDAYSLVLVEKGELILNIDYVPFTVGENMFLELRGQHIIQIVSVSEDFKAYHMIVSRNYLRSLLENDRPPTMASLNSRFSIPLTLLEKEEFTDLRDNLFRLRRNIERYNHAYQGRMIENELTNLIFEIWNFRVLKARNEDTDEKNTNRERVVMDFFKLLLANGRKEREVAFYAEKLFVTPVYLSRAIKQTVGLPAIKVINDIVLSDARALLRKSDTTIQQVAEELNFSDQFSFSKFFKKHTGVSPSEYRKG